MASMAEQGERADVVFMDPPRAGSDERFLSSLMLLAPRGWCIFPATRRRQERDLRFLTAVGIR